MSDEQKPPALGVGSNALLGAIVSADEYSSQWPRCLRIVSMRMDEAEALLAEVEKLRLALADIADPISAWRRDLKDDERLDGAMAVHLANDPETYRSMARDALQPNAALRGVSAQEGTDGK